jgi:hypothetical protein
MMVACDEIPPDHLTLDLVRALPDLRDLSFAHEALHAMFARVTVATKHLDCLCRQTHGKVTRLDLDHGCFDADVLLRSVARSDIMNVLA